jgi:ribosomal protein S12 methylthiotransferase
MSATANSTTAESATTGPEPSHSAALISLGCSKNLADSEDLVTTLRSCDFGLTTDLPNADLILVNTCGFIEDAKRESIDHILNAADERKSDAKLFVAGCLTERYLDDLQRDLPEVDQWVTFKDYDRFAAIVHDHFPTAPDHRLRHDQRSQLTPPHYAFLKIAEGCDNTCNFCAIPLFRGKHVSRPAEELLAQARTLAARGTKEINLISQHLDYYGVDIDGTQHLPQLLRDLGEALPEDCWLRLHYIYPNDFSDELITTMAEVPQVVPYIDMPIQHGSDRVLAVMGRRTTRAHITDRLDRIRAVLPDVVLRSTFIVGFPGERPADVDELIDFLEEQRFDQVGAFKYSDEDGTTAANMPKKVAEEDIEARYDAVMQAQAAVHQEQLERWNGQDLRVLVDEQLDFDTFACRHYGQASEVDNITRVSQAVLEVGTWADVTIEDTDGYDLIGRIRE